MQAIYYDRELADQYIWWTLSMIVVECDCDQVSVSTVRV
jgi:hypothetical protein